MRTVMMLILLCGVPSLATAQLDTLIQARAPGGATRLLLYEDGGFALRGAFGVGEIPATGPGVRLMWYPAKAAFRTGSVDGTQWDNANIGDYSTAMGFGTTASGVGSTAMGGGTTASDAYSTAMGAATEASGSFSTAMGFNTTASGQYATTMGFGTTAQAYSSLVIGRYNLVSGIPNAWVETDPLFVAGNGQDSGNRSNALTLLKTGNLTLSGSVESESGGFIFPDGTVQMTAASGEGTLPTNGAGSYDLGNDNGLVAEGTLGTGAIPATGPGVRLMWYPKKAAFRAGKVAGDEWNDDNIGVASVAIGEATVANANWSLATGSETRATGSYSTATGFGTEASGWYSTAMGANSTAQAHSSLVIGKYNVVSGNTFVWVDTDPIFVVGNGTFGNPSNALTLLKNGQFGLGTDTPAEALHVRDPAGRSALFLGGDATNGPHGLIFDDETAGDGLQLFYRTGPNRLLIEKSSAGTGTDGTDAFFYDRDDDVFYFGGNVGIGTTAPASALDVRSGGTEIAARLKVNDSWPLRLVQTDSSYFSIHNGGSPRLTIVHNGRVGIGTTTPSSRLEVNGTVRATDFVNTSDARFKRNVRPLEDPLELVAGLRGVSYEWDRAQHPEWEPGRRLGFLAQEVAEVLPELVRADEAGYLSVNYQAMLPVLVEALKAQQRTIQAQHRTIQAQQGEITALREALETQGREVKGLLRKFDALLSRLAEPIPSTVKAASH